MKFFRTLGILFISFALCQNLYADTNTSAGDRDVFYAIQKNGVIKVGVSILPPWVMENKKGELIGFEIDIAKQLAKDMGVKVKFMQYQWNLMIPALKKGEIDIIASGLSITAKRAMQINFSTPYSSSGYSLVTNMDLTKDITSIKHLNSEKIYITAVKGSVSADLAKRVFPNAIIDLRDTMEEATSAVVNGSAHACISPSPMPEFMAMKHKSKVDMPLKEPLLTTKEAFAIRKGNNEMLNYLNTWIVAHDADEWIESTHQYWFHSFKWQSQVAE